MGKGRAKVRRRLKTQLPDRTHRGRRGVALAEYAFFLGAATLIILLAYVVMGHKVADLSGSLAGLLPGHGPEDDVTFRTRDLIEFTHDSGDARFDISRIGGANSNRLGDNLGLDLSNVIRGSSGPPPSPPPPPPFNGPAEIQALRDRLVELRIAGQVLNQGGTFGALNSLLSQAEAAAAVPDNALAIQRLQQFKSEVLIRQAQGTVTPAAAAELINRADAIINGLQ
jgi:hypothetical protein